jgi:hypothetical protein
MEEHVDHRSADAGSVNDKAGFVGKERIDQ